MNPEKQRPRARNQHLSALETGRTCIDCHKGIAHKSVRDLLSEEELEALEAPNPEYVREVPAEFLAGLARIEAKEAEAKAQQLAETRRQRKLQQAAKVAQARHTEEAVAQARSEMQAVQDALRVQLDALKSASASSAASAPAPTLEVATVAAAPAATDSAAQEIAANIDWSKANKRQITLLYPGEASMEWVLVGKYHGGARPFRAGDRCFDCHDNETADMGAKIVAGETAESTPIEGKRGSIPVSVQAAHDGQNLYLRFQWQATEHVPVTFADGGKMDPENQIKLAFMLATDDVKYASQAGCWGACHHDLRSMPNHPQDASAAGLALDFSHGVTKYISASRTKIEEKGRRQCQMAEQGTPRLPQHLVSRSRRGADRGNVSHRIPGQNL
jgi:cytochrome c-type protein NapC